MGFETIRNSIFGGQSGELAIKYARQLRELIEANQQYVDNYFTPEKIRTPFASAQFLSAMRRLTSQIGNKILDYHLVSDELSARIPTLVLLSWQRRVADYYEIPLPAHRATFLLLGGKSQLHQQSVKSFLNSSKANPLFERKLLLVTDTLDTGHTVDNFIETLSNVPGQQLPEIDIASLNHYEDLIYYGAENNLYIDIAGREHPIYFGQIGATKNPFRIREPAYLALYGNHLATGLRRGDIGPDSDLLVGNIRDAFPRVRFDPKSAQGEQEYQLRLRLLDQLIRIQAGDFATTLPIP